MSLTNSKNSLPSANGAVKRKRSVHNRLERIEKKDGITSYTLPANGLKVLYAHVKGSVTVTTTIVYNVGSRHEESGDTGLAHMLEHMLFKDTTGKGAKWKDLEHKGAHLNATTWLDRTLYYFTLPTEYLGDMLEVEADRMRNTLLTDKEFQPERTNVLSEYEIQNSTPVEVLTWNMIATAFQNHGYHHDTIGWRGDIERYTTTQLQRFYDRYYWPHNATLIIAGDIQESVLSDEVEKHFGHLPTHTPYTPTPRVEGVQEGVRRVVLSRKTPLRVLNIAWKAPAFSHKDWLPLMVALNHLTDGETSSLYKALIDTHLATNVETALYPTHDPYLAYLTIHGAEHVPYSEIETVALKVVATAMKRPLTEKKLSLLKESLLAEEAASRDGSRAVALSLAEYVATGDWKQYPNTTRDIKRITVADVTRVMETYLVLERATIGTIEQP
jgi:zinc protease